METIEQDHYKSILGAHSIWLRYVDDVLAIIPSHTNTDNILAQLNQVEGTIQFTSETEVDNQLPFLDVSIQRTQSGPKFKVYRKATNRNDFIHYLSARSEKVKSGIIIGFFLRAYRICSPEYLEEEFTCIHQKCFS